MSLTFYPYEKFHFVFEADAGDGYRSDIAIDDIIISQGMCLDCTGDGLFACGDEDNMCILDEFQCDGYRDCPNGSDEDSCLKEDTLTDLQETCSSDSMRNLAVCRSENYEGNCLNSTEGSQLCDGNWDCRYGYDEAGCSTVVDPNRCGSPDPEPRHTMGWATGRAKFQEVNYKWAWTGTLYYGDKFQCSVHMVADDWYLSTLECVKKGLVKTKKSSEWYTYGGCSIEEEINIERRVGADGFTIEHHNVYGKLVVYNVARVILHPDSSTYDAEENQMVLINTVFNPDNLIRRPICFNAAAEQRFLFNLERPHLCQLVGHRPGKKGEKVLKWQALAPVTKIDDTLWAGYRMLLVQPFHDDPGTALYCQAWDQRWHLVGILKKHTPEDIGDKRANWPSIRAGLNTFSDIQYLSSWVQQECPGQFLCKTDKICILLQNVCDGRIDCSDGSDENKCTSGCGGSSWLEGDGGSVSVANYVKSCTWIYNSAPDQLGVIRIEKILTDVPYKIIKYDSVDQKWITFNKPIQFLSSNLGASLTIRINLETEGDVGSLLDLSLKYHHETLDGENEVACDKQYRCENNLKCISPELVCNGEKDCPSGDDETDCHKTECGSGRYLTATEEENVLLSQNFPNPWFGKFSRKMRVRFLCNNFRSWRMQVYRILITRQPD